MRKEENYARIVYEKFPEELNYCAWAIIDSVKYCNANHEGKIDEVKVFSFPSND